MPIFINNSLSRKKEEFAPLNPPKVNIYTCGVTVYDECHIGHARSLYIFDCIRRYLEYRNFKVNFVRNITDIDDKIINRAKELKRDWKELVKQYIDGYYEDLKSLSITKANYEPRATENIPDMIKYIEGLIDKGYAYVTDSGVYFSVRKFKDYGKLSGQGIEQMLTGVRKEPDETKEDPLDFTLWKISKPDEPSWESPWGKGRPGWHIECSVMSQKYLKADTLDIHAGGRDLIFPHHENEIAQSEALTNKPFAKYWIHHGLLTINAQKMSKSLGNFVTIKDFIAKYKNADLLKLFFLSAHYSHSIDYNEDKIGEAKKQKKTFEEFLFSADFWRQYYEYRSKQPEARELTKKTDLIETTQKDKEKVEKLSVKFEQAMDDDFNMPQGLSYLFELVDLGATFNSQDKRDGFELVETKLKTFLEIFGITIPKFEEISQDILKQILKREIDRRINKDFIAADEERQKLWLQGYIVSDTGTSASCTLIRLPNS